MEQNQEPGPAPEPDGPAEALRARQSPPTAGEVFALVRDGLADTRREVARRAGLSRTAVTARINALIGLGLVTEAAEGPSTGGRPPARLRLNADGGVVLAAAIGRSRTQLAVCDLAGNVRATRDLDQEVGMGPDELMPRVVKDLEAMLDDLGHPVADVRGVGLSIPGTVDRERCCSLDSPVMAGWDGVVLADYVTEHIPVPVLLDNDANVMALSERRGHLERFADLVMVKASTGLGAGIVSAGELQRGALGAAGEIGHNKVGEPSDPADPSAPGNRPCRCGDRGCVEAVAGGWALVQVLREQGREVGHVRDVVALAQQGDADAKRLIRESGRRFGDVLSGVVNLLNPAAIIVGGDMAAVFDNLAAGVRESVYGGATALATRDLEILPATHGDRAGVVGCAALVLEDVLSARAVDRAL